MKTVKVPKDETLEREQRELQKKLTAIVIQHIEYAHERTQEAMEKGNHDDADAHSSTCYMWLCRLTGGQ